MRRIGLWWLITTITSNVAIVSMAEGQEVGDARRGLAYARSICSECHNVLDTDAASPNERAPAFKAIAKTPGMSITALTVWSRTSHPTMPNFVIAPSDMDDLVAYILSLRGPQ
jgi:mono/diheme cytochrome c family protein